MTTTPKAILKHCMRCGAKSIYRKDNSLKCTSCDFCFYINSAAAVAAIIVNEKGEILLTERAYEPSAGKLDLPGGFVDIGEPAEKTVARELQEELGVELLKASYLGSYSNEYIYSGLTVYTLDLAFECQVKCLNTITPQDDVLAYSFVDPKQIDFEAIAFYSIQRILKDYIQKASEGSLLT